MATEIKVLSSIATREAYNELVPLFERDTGHTIVTTWAGTVDIMKRLSAGGEVHDLVVLSSVELDDLIKLGKIAAGSRVDIAKSGIGVAVRAGAPKPDIGSADALKRTLLAAKTVGYTSGPSGVYMAGLSSAWGSPARSSRSIRGVPSGGTIGTIVASGDCEIGFQQISELVHIKGIDYVGPLPPDVQRVTIFATGIPAGASNPDGARALVKFLTTPAAAPSSKSTAWSRAEQPRRLGGSVVKASDHRRSSRNIARVRYRQAAEIRVLASNAIKAAYLELVPQFEKSSGHKVTTTWSGTLDIKKRLAAGETYDLLIMAAPELDEFIKQGKLVAGSRIDLVKSGVGIAVKAGAPKPDIGSAESLKATLLICEVDWIFARPERRLSGGTVSEDGHRRHDQGQGEGSRRRPASRQYGRKRRGRDRLPAGERIASCEGHRLPRSPARVDPADHHVLSRPVRRRERNRRRKGARGVSGGTSGDAGEKEARPGAGLTTTSAAA